jgi:AraC-like DNA-binding protein
MERASIPVEKWEELAEAAHYRAHLLAALREITTRQLRRQIRRHFKRSPQEWLNEQRIAAAEQMLLAGRPIKVVAFEVGFKQVSHFCRVFKSVKQMTPSEFALLQPEPAQSPERITNVRNG